MEVKNDASKGQRKLFFLDYPLASFVTTVYISMSAMGLFYWDFFLSRFGVNLLDYLETSDFFTLFLRMQYVPLLIGLLCSLLFVASVYCFYQSMTERRNVLQGFSVHIPYINLVCVVLLCLPFLLWMAFFDYSRFLEEAICSGFYVFDHWLSRFDLTILVFVTYLLLLISFLFNWGALYAKHKESRCIEEYKQNRSIILVDDIISVKHKAYSFWVEYFDRSFFSKLIRKLLLVILSFSIGVYSLYRVRNHEQLGRHLRAIKYPYVRVHFNTVRSNAVPEWVSSCHPVVLILGTSTYFILYDRVLDVVHAVPKQVVTNLTMLDLNIASDLHRTKCKIDD